MKRKEELKVLIDCLLNGFLQEQMKKVTRISFRLFSCFREKRCAGWL